MISDHTQIAQPFMQAFAGIPVYNSAIRRRLSVFGASFVLMPKTVFTCTFLTWLKSRESIGRE